jgi:hypothetical protein
LAFFALKEKNQGRAWRNIEKFPSLLFNSQSMKPLLFSSLVFLLTGCFTTTPEDPESTNRSGLKPVYISLDSVRKIRFLPARATTKAGKIYAYGNLLFQNESATGIHVIDNTNPDAPQKVGFYQVPLCTEISIRQGFLYTNNGADLVVIDIRNPQQPVVGKRLEGHFPNFQQIPPAVAGTYFECPDPKRGYIAEWVPASLYKPTCRVR